MNLRRTRRHRDGATANRPSHLNAPKRVQQRLVPPSLLRAVAPVPAIRNAAAGNETPTKEPRPISADGPLLFSINARCVEGIDLTKLTFANTMGEL